VFERGIGRSLEQLAWKRSIKPGKCDQMAHTVHTSAAGSSANAFLVEGGVAKGGRRSLARYTYLALQLSTGEKSLSITVNAIYFKGAQNFPCYNLPRMVHGGVLVLNCVMFMFCE